MSRTSPFLSAIALLVVLTSVPACDSDPADGRVADDLFYATGTIDTRMKTLLAGKTESTAAPTAVRLIWRSMIEPPLVDLESLAVTDLEQAAGRVYIGYGREGSVVAGALDILDAAAPTIPSSGFGYESEYFEVTSVDASGSRILMGGVYEPGFGVFAASSAAGIVSTNVNVEDVLFGDLSSNAVVDIDAAGNTLLAASGPAGGLYLLDLDLSSSSVRSESDVVSAVLSDEFVFVLLANGIVSRFERGAAGLSNPVDLATVGVPTSGQPARLSYVALSDELLVPSGISGLVVLESISESPASITRTDVSASIAGRATQAVRGPEFVYFVASTDFGIAMIRRDEFDAFEVVQVVGLGGEAAYAITWNDEYAYAATKSGTHILQISD